MLHHKATERGEVQTTTSHLYRKSLARKVYIAQSGGVTRKADDKHIYVMRASGSVMVNGNVGSNINGVDMKPGDPVVVPLDAGKDADASSTTLRSRAVNLF